jgi:hypothetical protein
LKINKKIKKIEKIRIAQIEQVLKFINLRRFDLELKVFVKDLILLQGS